MGEGHAIVEHVRSATVVVSTGPPGVGESVGTGFFVAPGRVLTCAHVIEQAGPTAHVRWFGQAAAVEVHATTPAPAPGQKRTGGDAAVLHLDTTDHPCVPLAPRPAQVDDTVWAYGITSVRRGPDLPPEFDSSLLKVSGATATGPDGASAGAEYLILSDGRVSPGMSGGPLVNLTSLGVCGLVQSRMPVPALGGWAVPLEQAIALGAPEDLRALNPAESVSLATLRQSQLALGGLPGLARTKLTMPAAELLHAYLQEQGVDAPELVGDDLREWVARKLFTLTLAGLIGALGQLAEGEPRLARNLFELVAPCLPVSNKAPWWWITGDAAVNLRGELDRAAPRLVHVATDEERTVRLLLRRAYDGLNLVVQKPTGAAGAEAGPSGLLQDTEDDLHAEMRRLLGAKGGDEWVLTPDVARALRESHRFFQIDVGACPDLPVLQAFADRYGGARFVVSRRNLTVPDGGDGLMLRLVPEIDATNEEQALYQLDFFVEQYAQGG